MPTTRYSSIWDRLRHDNTSFSESDWNLWLQTNYPDIIARNEYGGYINEHDNPRSWGICPITLGQITWLYLRNVITATQAREVFSLSDHESSQMGDIKNWITSAGTVQAQILRWMDLTCLMDMIEQRGIISKSYIYNMMGIRADSNNG